MYSKLERADGLLALISSWLGVLAALGMVGSLLLGVFHRYVLQSALSWTEEIGQLLFVWTIFLIGSSLVRCRGHVRVTLLLHLLPRALEELLERLLLILIIAFGLVMLWYGWQYTVFTLGQSSSAIRYPMWWQYSAVPVSGALIAWHALVMLLAPTRLAGLDAEVINE